MKLKDLLKVAIIRKIRVYDSETIETLIWINCGDTRYVSKNLGERKVKNFAISGEEAFTLNVFVK